MTTSSTDRTTVLLIGVTGRLGGNIASTLLDQGAEVRALVRPGSAEDPAKAASLNALKGKGLSVTEGSLLEPASLPAACEGVDVVVSAINGDHKVTVEGQTNFIRAAEAAGVPA